MSFTVTTSSVAPLLQYTHEKIKEFAFIYENDITKIFRKGIDFSLV